MGGVGVEVGEGEVEGLGGVGAAARAGTATGSGARAPAARLGGEEKAERIEDDLWAWEGHPPGEHVQKHTKSKARGGHLFEYRIWSASLTPGATLCLSLAYLSVLVFWVLLAYVYIPPPPVPPPGLGIPFSPPSLPPFTAPQSR